MYSALNHKNVLITGASGLIGRNLISAIHNGAPECHIIGLVRCPAKAKKKLHQGEPWLTLVEADVREPVWYDGPVDYIIHGAAMTASRSFVEAPVETILTSVDGTRNLLELAKEKKVKSFLLLSTMEVYGAPSTDEKIREDAPCCIDPMQPRSSYPESKRLCESLCSAYWKEYGVPAKVIRLAQTFGPGVEYNDTRVFAEFARCAIEKRDIILHTKGETKRSYLYTEDAASAILTVLLKGKPGEAYNAANEETYCSIYEMAQLVANECAGGEIAVKIQIEDENKFGYAPVLKMNLDTSKLRALGWRAKSDLVSMYSTLIASMTFQKDLYAW